MPKFIQINVATNKQISFILVCRFRFFFWVRPGLYLIKKFLITEKKGHGILSILQQEKVKLTEEKR